LRNETSPKALLLGQLRPGDKDLTIFLQTIDEIITFKLLSDGTVACIALYLELPVIKTTAVRKGQAMGHAIGHAKLALCENGSGSRPKRTRDRAAKKQALLHAALRLFAAKGYEVTTTREIAASAGCAEGLIHRYFKGKPGLLAAMIEHRVSKEALALTHPTRPARNLAEEFLRLVDGEVERMWESRDFLRVLIPRAIVDPSLGGFMNKALISVRADAISERLKHYESCVTLPKGAMEVLAQAVGMLGFVFGFVRPVLLGHDRLRAKKMAATVAKVLLGSPAVSATG
jgi:AcrR family transcriptional regulator